MHIAALFYLLSLLTMMESSSMKKLVIFANGDNTNHRHTIRSAIEHGFDSFRKSLTVLMSSLDDNIRYMNEYENSSKIDLKPIHDKFRKDVSIIPSLWEENEIFLRLLLSTSQIDIMYGITSPSSSSYVPFESNFKRNDTPITNDNTSSSTTTTTTTTTKISSYDSLENILLHLHRDWSNDDCITSHITLLLNKVNETMKPSKRQNSDIKILVPGAALGRVAIELASLGYSVEMNECSPTMITAFNTIINKLLLSDDEYYYYPYLHATLNDAWDYSVRNQAKIFPPSNVSHLQHWARDGQNLLSLHYGDFVNSYKIHERKTYFDVIVTSFFIDTGNIIEYLDVIKYILKPDGVWINMGPLHYHSASTIKYSYNQLLEITSLLGFQLLNQSHVEGPYGCNKDINMKPDYYIVPLDVFKLTETIKTEDNNNSNNSNSDDNKVDWKSPTFSLI